MKGTRVKHRRPVPRRVSKRRGQSVPMVRTAAGSPVPVQAQYAIGKGKADPKTKEVLFFPPFFFNPFFPSIGFFEGGFIGPFGGGFGAGFFI